MNFACLHCIHPGTKHVIKTPWKHVELTKVSEFYTLNVVL